MERHPQPEVVRLHVQFAFDVDDVGGDQQQPSAAVGAGREIPGGGGEGLVLAEDPGGEERQQHAQFHAGDLAADGAHDHGAGAGAATFLHLVEQGFEQLAEAGDVGPHPAGAVDHEKGRVMGLGVPRLVKPRTCSSADRAWRRSSATTARASSRLTSGPGRMSLVAVATARFQSTMDEAAPPMLVMCQRYVRGGETGRSCSRRGLRPGRPVRAVPRTPKGGTRTPPRRRRPCPRPPAPRPAPSCRSRGTRTPADGRRGPRPCRPAC